MRRTDDLPSLEDVLAKSFQEMKAGPAKPEVTTSTDTQAQPLTDDGHTIQSYTPPASRHGTYQAPIHASAGESSFFTAPPEHERKIPTPNDTSHVVSTAASKTGDDFDVAWGEEE
jgi:hypothetical protein